MAFQSVPNKVDFVELEKQILEFWKENRAFEVLRELRSRSDKHWSFIDGPITANNPMGVHHAWGRTYKDLYQRFKAMQGYDQRWQNGFDCQGLWVEVNVERALGFNSKREIEKYGLARFVKECKMRVLEFAAVQTEQSIRLGYWMDWNDPDELRLLRRLLGEDPEQEITVDGTAGPLTGTVEQIVGQLGMPRYGGSYFTLSDENNYQIWGFLRSCHDRGWLYKGRDVMPWCARCGTGISQHEIVTDGYHEVTHESVFLRFPLENSESDNDALLVWTTTPWTLTSNVAAAVGPDLTYVKIKQKEDGWIYYLAKDTMASSLIGEYEVLDELKGSEMVGWKYRGPFDELTAVQEVFSEAEYNHRVVTWKEVDASEGTGIVHIAPGCGAEDFELSQEHKLPVVAPLDENGIYDSGFDWLTGRSASDVANDIFEDLRRKGFHYRKQRYRHRYPHCWRCGEELVYRLVDEWFIDTGPLYDKPREEVTKEEKARSFRYQIMDSVDEVNWFPSFGYDREMDWLRNMHDWMISKKRYYGLAIPIWICGDCEHFDVIGSREELEERAVDGWEQFDGHSPHRPYIDQVKISCSQCGGLSSRISDVGNPWLDAGIVAYSTLDYSGNRDYWEKWFPADLVTESFPGQFRNWFYSLLAQSTALTGRSPFKNLFGYASLYGEDGREMHKSWGNAVEFNEAADTIGADTMRWLFSIHKPEQNLNFGYKLGDDTRRRFMIPLWNVYSFLVTYANIDDWRPADNIGDTSRSQNQANAQLDEWILTRLDEVILSVTKELERYAAHKAAADLESFLDDVSNWYIRRSRRRFWKSETDSDKEAAYATLYKVVVELAKLLAPFIPFTSETIYQNLVRSHNTSAPLSVHHLDWPVANPELLDRDLLAKMRLAINVASLGRSARGSADIKLRQPLARARVHVGSKRQQKDLIELADVLVEEINVKEIEVVSEVGELVNYKLTPNNRILGPKYGALFPVIRKKLEQLDPAAAASTLQSGHDIVLEVEGKETILTPEEILVQTESRGGLAVASDKGVTVAVDTELTAELVHEGQARDAVRYLNTMRKDAGLALDDRIHIFYRSEGSITGALVAFREYIMQETLAVSMTADEADPDAFTQVFKIEDDSITFSISKA